MQSYWNSLHIYIANRVWHGNKTFWTLTIAGMAWYMVWPGRNGIVYGMVGWLCWGLTSQSSIFQSCRDGAIASWVINQYFRGVKCLAQGHNTAEVGLEPRTSRSGVRHSTTEPPRSPVYGMAWGAWHGICYGLGGHGMVYGITWVDMAWYMVWPGGHDMVYVMAWRAYGIDWRTWHGIWYGLAGIWYSLAGNGMVYVMTWRAWHFTWYGLTGMACYMFWPGGLGMVCGMAWRE